MPFPTGSDFNLPDHFLTEVGRIAIEWSYLEYCLEEALWTVMYLRVPDRDLPPATTTHIPFRVRLDMLSSIAIALKLNEDLLAELNEILLEVDEQHQWRNLAIHSKWYSFSNDPSEKQWIARTTARRKGHKATYYEPDFETLKSTHADIKALRERVQKWSNDAWTALPKKPI